jgi:L-lactate dehydrogenase complex protein LldG
VSDRELILGRIRAALRDVPSSEPDAWIVGRDPDPAASYTRGQPGQPAALTELFTERCADYGAGITCCEAAAEQIAAAIGAACAKHGATALVAPATLAPAWIPAGLVPLLDEPPLTVEQLDGCDGVITSCALAIAATGTIVLDGGDGQGRRALTLVPDLHICVVRVGQLVSNLPDAMGAVAAATTLRRPVTFISGPSATSDIELKRVNGVHGPRRLEIVLAGDADGV